MSVELNALDVSIPRETKVAVLKMELEQMDIGFYRLKTAAEVCQTVGDKQNLDQLKKQLEMAKMKLDEYKKMIRELEEPEKK